MALTDEDIQKQLTHMISFIEQEAKEKSEEIDSKAEEEFNFEKGRLVVDAKNKIKEEFDRKEKRVELERKIQNSHAWNLSRLNILKTRQNIIDEVMQEAQEKLAEIMKDQERYKELLQKLIEQALFQLLEKSVTIRCRQEDLQLVLACVHPALQSYKAATHRECDVTVDRENFLPPDTIGGVDMYARYGKIKVSNTLENRLEMIGKQLLPSIRVALFEANPNRRFMD